jgi:peptidoglycan hydrolase-like protein with peptidoglycan-binding domain
LAAEEVKPENDPFGTVALARVLLTEQTKPSWKYSPNEAVKQWQAKVGLTADGKFGPGSALRMAQEVGVLPWVRYFAKGAASKAAAVNDFRGRVKAYALSIIKTKPELAGALLVSADAEQGQGWPATTPTAAPAKAPTPEQIDAAIAVLMKQADSRTV